MFYFCFYCLYYHLYFLNRVHNMKCWFSYYSLNMLIFFFKSFYTLHIYHIIICCLLCLLKMVHIMFPFCTDGSNLPNNFVIQQWLILITSITWNFQICIPFLFNIFIIFSFFFLIISKMSAIILQTCPFSDYRFLKNRFIFVIVVFLFFHCKDSFFKMPSYL